jgi:predicted ATPase
MRYHFYIDNFRGFSSTFIPVTDVNFLVGENSTGKTSVLSLIKLLTAPQFLFNSGFSDEHVNFGHFSDMVSAHSDDKSYFSVGVVTEEISRQGKLPIANACLLTFMPEEGLPRMTRVTLCRGIEKVSIRVRGKSAYYKREKYDTPTTVDEIISTLLPQWNREHRLKDKSPGFKKLPSPSGLMLPIMYFLSLILREKPTRTTNRNERDSDDLTLQYPPRIFIPDLKWLAPIRTKPRRTYDELTLDFSPEGSHTPYLIRAILRSKAATKFNSFIDKLGKASGLFQSIKIKNFGKGVTAPFEVDVILDGKALNLSTVGYGVSQSLPVFAEILASEHSAWFAIQQPEVHLHPRAQAALGDLFFESASVDRKCFLIETHSDFTIDRFRMNYAKNVDYKPDSQILFFERKDKHNTVTPLKIGETGDLPSHQPDTYREFFIREEMQLLGI